MNVLETEVMAKVLRGEHPILATLRTQFAVATIRSRDFTGTGFMTEYSVPSGPPRVSGKDRIVIGDVAGEVAGLPLGAGFLLFVRDGVLDALEGYSYDAVWGEDRQLLRTYYIHPDPLGKGGLVEIPERDLSWALRDAVHEGVVPGDRSRAAPARR
jgi:hypothetical protein